MHEKLPGLEIFVLRNKILFLIIQYSAYKITNTVQGEDGGSIGGGGGSFEFGVDPNDDPELALALRSATILQLQPRTVGWAHQSTSHCLELFHYDHALASQDGSSSFSCSPQLVQ